MQTTEAQTVERTSITTRPAKLEDRIREACRVRHYADRGPRVLVCDVASLMKIKPQAAYFAADMMVDQRATDLRRVVALANAEQDPAALGRLYAELVGYDLHEDDPPMSVDGLRAMLTEFVGEIYHADGIDREVVGLN